MRQLYCYGISFSNKKVETGFMSLTVDLFAGDTDENCISAVECICEAQGYDITKARHYSICRIPNSVILEHAKEIINEHPVSRPGDDWTPPDDESDNGSGDSTRGVRGSLEE